MCGQFFRPDVDVFSAFFIFGWTFFRGPFFPVELFSVDHFSVDIFRWTLFPWIFFPTFLTKRIYSMQTQLLFNLAEIKIAIQSVSERQYADLRLIVKL